MRIIRNAWSRVGHSLLPWLLAIAASGGPATTAAQAPAAPGPTRASYVAVSVNGGKLPSTDMVTDARGTRFLVEFDEMVLAIRRGNEFRASLRYRQALATKGVAMQREPIQSMTVYGRYEVRGNALRFIPDPKRGGKGLEIQEGTFTAGKIEVPFWYRNGSVARNARVVMRLDPSRI